MLKIKAVVIRARDRSSRGKAFVGRRGARGGSTHEGEGEKRGGGEGRERRERWSVRKQQPCSWCICARGNLEQDHKKNNGQHHQQRFFPGDGGGEMLGEHY